MKGYEDSFVVEGKMALPYTYFAAGLAASSSQYPDQKKLWE